MTRHSKNATAGPTYTYHEKNKDSKQSGYGTKDVRVSKDGIKVSIGNFLLKLIIQNKYKYFFVKKEFDCCSLSLQPCRNPVK